LTGYDLPSHHLSPLPGWAVDPAARAVIDALSIPGFDPRFVGGCVRDGLLGRKMRRTSIIATAAAAAEAVIDRPAQGGGPRR
jgi:hypothetical protein